MTVGRAALTVPLAAIAVMLCLQFHTPGKGRHRHDNEENMTALEMLELTYDAAMPKIMLVVPPLLAALHSKDFRDHDIYEFGVRYGGGLRGFREQLSEGGVQIGHTWGFDSFTGLPASLVNQGGKSNYSGYVAGDFGVVGSAKKQFRTWPEAEQAITKSIGPETTLIEGFFNESLTDELPAQRKMKPAFFISVDCDLYGSTIQALEWLLKHEMLKAGTFVYYDEFDDGEGPAHRELSDKYGLEWEDLAYFHSKDLPKKSCCGDMNLVKLKKIGKAL